MTRTFLGTGEATGCHFWSIPSISFRWSCWVASSSMEDGCNWRRGLFVAPLCAYGNERLQSNRKEHGVE